MKKSKLTIVLYIYFFICIIHSSYEFYKMGKNFFYPQTEKTVIEQKNSINKPTKSKSVHTSNKPVVRTQITQFNYNFEKNNELYPIENDIVMNDNDFNMYKKEYNYLLNKYFTKNQLKGIQGIIIADAEMFTGKAIGITESINGDSYITIAARSNDSMCIVHEACHAMMAKYIDVFNIFYKDKWVKSKKYVSDYAKSNIYEDFAETGTAYLTGDTLKFNPKFKLFEQFYNQIK